MEYPPILFYYNTKISLSPVKIDELSLLSKGGKKKKNQPLHSRWIPSLLASLNYLTLSSLIIPPDLHSYTGQLLPNFNILFIVEALKQLANAHRLHLTPIYSSVYSLPPPVLTTPLKPLLTSPFTSYDVLLLLCQSATCDIINHSLFQEIILSWLGFPPVLSLNASHVTSKCLFFRIPSWAWCSLSALFFLGNLSNSQTL